MRHTFGFFGSRFGCSDVHTAVQLHGIAGDDLAVKKLRQMNGKRRFARSGRTDHTKQLRIIFTRRICHTESPFCGRERKQHPPPPYVGVRMLKILK